MNKKVFAVIGMVVCVVFILMGFSVLGRENECSTVYRSGSYTSGYGTFGADFYTYSNNNAAEAAGAARITANNIYELYALLTDVFGWLFVFAGLIGFCQFGVVFAESKATDVVVNEESPVVESVEDLTFPDTVAPEEGEMNEMQLPNV